MEGQERVCVAGDIEHMTALERKQNGIPLHASVIRDLRTLSREFNLPFALQH